ncbi:MAG: hypothetical protein ABEH65_01460 [Halobacteriales archaeon]
MDGFAWRDRPATMFSILASVFGRGDPEEKATSTETDRTGTADHTAAGLDSSSETTDSRGTDSVVDRLIEELETGELTPEQRATLQNTFGGTLSRSESVSLEHLKAEVMDLRAYTDALEELIDETGTADDRFEACHDRIDTLDARIEDELDALRADLEAADTRADIERIETRMDELETAVGTLHRELATVKTAVEELRTWQAGIKAAVSEETSTPDSAEIDPSATASEIVFEVE